LINAEFLRCSGDKIMWSHVNPSTGEAGRCTAQWNCPFSVIGRELGIDTHFKTIKEARAAGEKRKEELYGAFSTTSSGQKPLHTLIEMVNKDKLSKDEMHELATSDSPLVLEPLAKRTDLDLQTIDSIIKNGSNQVKKTLAANEELPEDAYLKLANMALIKDGFEEELANNKKTPTKALELLSKIKSWNSSFRGAIAVHPNATPEIIDELVMKNGLNVRYMTDVLAKIPNLKESTIRKLVDEGEPWDYKTLYAQLLTQKNCDKKTAEKMRFVLDYSQKIENNIITPKELDEIFEYDLIGELGTVKINVSKMQKQALSDKNLDDKIAIRVIEEELAAPSVRTNGRQTPSDSKLMRLLSNHPVKTQEYADTLKKLFNSDKADVAHKAKMQYVESDFVQAEELFDMANKIASTDYDNPDNYSATDNTQFYVKKEMQKQYDENLLVAICKNSKTTPQLLKKLSKNKSSWVKSIIAGNENTPQDVLLRYSTMSDRSGLISALGQNKKLPVEAQMNIAKNKSHKFWTLEKLLSNQSLDPAVIDYLADNGPKQLTATIKKHPRVSMKTLLKLSERENEMREKLAAVRQS